MNPGLRDLLFFQLLEKSLTAKSWGEEPQPDGVVSRAEDRWKWLNKSDV